MRTKFTINEILFELYLISAVIGGILRNMLGVWEPIYDTYTFVSKGRWGTLMLTISTIILLLLLFRCSIKFIKKVPIGIRILVCSLIFYYLLWTGISLNSNSLQSVFLGSISTSVILLPIASVVGFDNKIWSLLVKQIPIINILLGGAFFVAVISFWGQHGLKWPMNASYKGIFAYWITSVWIMTFVYFNEKKKRKFIYCNLVFIIIAAFITQSRAWVLQTLILFFVFFAVLSNKNKYIKFFMGCLFIVIAIVGISYIFPNITGSLFERGFEDTRSGQYVVFFKQHSWNDLLLGLGLNATYTYLGNDFYPYFDNQFMFIMFHYGILPVISWIVVYCYVFKGKKIINLKDEVIIRAAKYIGGFALLAYMGLSTYYQIELSYSSVLIMLLLGNAIQRKTRS